MHSCRQKSTAADIDKEGYQRTHTAKESTRELIAKKREIFMVQMGLDVKVEEIAKLKERAVQRDAALSKAEKMLEDDTKRFDAFLKENAAKLQEAVAFADTQTLAKQEKVCLNSFQHISPPYETTSSDPSLPGFANIAE